MRSKIRGVWYNFSNICHPGGNLYIELANGKDVTHVFEQHHWGDLVNSNRLNKYKEGNENRIVSIPNWYNELDHEVKSIIRERGLSKNIYLTLQIVRILFILGGSITSYILSFTNEWYLLLYVFFSIQVGFHIVHDASHGVLLKNKNISHIIGYISYDIISGLSYINWIRQHVYGHHAECNKDGLDPDINAYPIRLCNTQKYEWFHKYQLIYTFPLYSLTSFSMFINDLFSVHSRNRKESLLIILGKLIHLELFIIIPYNIYGNRIIYSYVVSHMIGSLIIAIIFQVSHISSKLQFNNNNNWIENEIKSTQDYRVNCKITSMVTGGLNMQVLHHLFPKVSQIYYPLIYEHVEHKLKKEEICITKYQTFFEAFSTHIKQLSRMSHI